MSHTELITRIVGGLVLVALNAIFVLTEFALTRARAIGEQAFEGERSLELAWSMTNELELYLTGCQLGISTSSVLLGVVAEPAVTALLQPVTGLLGLSPSVQRVTSVVVGLVLLNLVHKIWGEQAPTYFGVEEPVRAARLGAPVLYAWTKALYPLVILGDGLAKWTLRLVGVEVTRSWLDEDDEEAPATLRQALTKVMVEHRLPSERRDEVLGAFELDLVPTRDIMVPREMMAVLDADATGKANLEVIARTQKTRYPLMRGDQVVGVVYTPMLFARLEAIREDRASLEEVASPALWISEDLDLDALIDRLQEAKQEIALVTDEAGQLAGMVTATDAFEHIAGEMEDPSDRPFRRTLSEGAT